MKLLKINNKYNRKENQKQYINFEKISEFLLKYDTDSNCCLECSYDFNNSYITLLDFNKNNINPEEFFIYFINYIEQSKDLIIIPEVIIDYFNGKEIIEEFNPVIDKFNEIYNILKKIINKDAKTERLEKKYLPELYREYFSLSNFYKKENKINVLLQLEEIESKLISTGSIEDNQKEISFKQIMSITNSIFLEKHN